MTHLRNLQPDTVFSQSFVSTGWNETQQMHILSFKEVFNQLTQAAYTLPL